MTATFPTATDSIVFVVETQRANYLFGDYNDAEQFAQEENQAWMDQCPDMGNPWIHPVPYGEHHAFHEQAENVPNEAGPGQDSPEIQRLVQAWWRDRDNWWNQPRL